MKSSLIVLFTVALCTCEVDFNSRPRVFSLELVHFTQLETDGHVVISPFSIWTLMSSVALGTAGETYKQLQSAFLLPSDPKTLVNGYKGLTKSVLDPISKDVSLTSKNYLFLDNGFVINRSYQNVMRSEFGAMISMLNFKDPNTASRIANNLIENSGGVSNVLTSADFAQSKMILTNVISFKGLWSSPFNASETTVAPFYDESRNVIGRVNMMYQRAELPFSNIKDLKSFVVELPYGVEKKYSMLILLPHPKTSVNEVYKRLAKFSLVDVAKKLQDDIDNYGPGEIDVSIPRFKISTNLVLNKPLNDMGVYDIFEPDRANFSITSERIYVSAVVHKADIEVTESGTVATASTSAVLTDRITTPSIKADKPFIYFVMEKSTTTMIFGGIYSKPTLF